jgi:hypothetical protein
MAHDGTGSQAPARRTLTPPGNDACALQSTLQPAGTDRQIRLEPGERPPHEARPLDRGLGRARRRQRPGRVARPMLERLGHLDPRRNGVGAAAAREVLPRLEGIVIAADAPQQARAIRHDPLPIDPHDRR